MKKLFILSAVIAASLIATTGYSQVFVGAHIGFRLPAPRVYVAAPAPVVYGGEYAEDGYYAAPDICEADFPGYAYYDYPAWNGHYRDQYYFAHYRPFFERDHAAYFNRGRFDHERFDHERSNRGYGDRGVANRGYADRGVANRGYADRGYSNRGYSNRGSGNRGFGDHGHNDHGLDHRRGR